MTNDIRQPKGVPTGGQFAEHHRADATVELADPPVHATFIAEVWQGDWAQEIDRTDIDIRPVLDSLTLEEVEFAAKGIAAADTIYEMMRQRIFARDEAHDGPYTFDLDTPDVAEYINDRRQREQHEPIAPLRYSAARTAEIVHDTLRQEVFSQLRFSDLNQVTNEDAAERINDVGAVVRRLREQPDFDFSAVDCVTEDALTRIEWLVKTGRGSRSEAIELSARLADALIGTAD